MCNGNVYNKVSSVTAVNKRKSPNSPTDPLLISGEADSFFNIVSSNLLCLCLHWAFPFHGRVRETSQIQIASVCEYYSMCPI